jgi:hypothetical protein
MKNWKGEPRIIHESNLYQYIHSAFLNHVHNTNTNTATIIGWFEFSTLYASQQIRVCYQDRYIYIQKCIPDVK